MEVYVHLLSDVWPVQLRVDLAPLTPRTTSYLEDSSSYHLAEVLIKETLKLRLTPSGLVVTDPPHCRSNRLVSTFQADKNNNTTETNEVDMLTMDNHDSTIG